MTPVIKHRKHSPNPTKTKSGTLRTRFSFKQKGAEDVKHFHELKLKESILSCSSLREQLEQEEAVQIL